MSHRRRGEEIRRRGKSRRRESEASRRGRSGPGHRRLTLAAALAWDRLLGEPSPHPVRGIGAILQAGRTSRRSESPAGSLLEGALVLGAAVGAGALAARLASRFLGGGGGTGGRVLAQGALLKPALALEALLGAGEEVARALDRGEMDEARHLTAWHLVSRDTSRLSASQISSAVVESLSENLVDSVVAPSWAFLAAGLPAAWAYRAVNTADAVLGYRTPELEWFGKPAARLDDLLNLVPARWTGTALLLAGGRLQLLGALRREARKAAGPNAGWPMAAAALALGVRLEKPGTYVLNPGGRAPKAEDIARAVRLVRHGALVALGGLLLLTRESSS
jgi:adenosylcobinamide-phosphate synthase